MPGPGESTTAPPKTELERVATAATRVRTVADPAAFTDILTTDRPRIAIVSEPPAGPHELKLTLHEQRRRHGLRTIHLSSEAAMATRMAALRAGFDEALPQTIQVAELAARAALLEERARARSAGCLPIADGFELDLVAHELRLDGRSVHLRPQEYQLLAMLAAHPGRAYTRRQILDPRLGSRPGRRSTNRRRPRPLASLQDRTPTEPPRSPRDGPRRRLPARPAVNGALTRRQTAVDATARPYAA